MEQKQTAVEYLIEQLFPKALSEEQYYHIDKAKEMEKQQIMDAYDDGANERHNDPVNGEQYYNEEYGK